MLLLGQSRLIHNGLEEGDPTTKKGMWQEGHIPPGRGCSLLPRCNVNPGQDTALRVLTDLGQ